MNLRCIVMLKMLIAQQPWGVSLTMATTLTHQLLVKWGYTPNNTRYFTGD